MKYRFARMTPEDLRKLFDGTRGRSVMGGIFVFALGLAALAFVQWKIQLDELDRESADLHRRASQLVGQHDAHLTALSAIAVASAGQRPDLFLDVSAAISQFYPRIEAVFLVPLDRTQAGIGSVPLPPGGAEAIRQAARRSTGVPVLMSHPSRPGHYLMIKRSPNSDAARYALALGIDAAQLVSSDAAFWARDNVRVGLSLPGGARLIGPTDAGEMQVSEPLASLSQPLQMEAGVRLGLPDLLPVWQVLGMAALVAIGYGAVLTGLRQRARLRVAEREAELRRVEAQLTHAMRVNSMGEMASGMAHELTQPLTAILAQLQSGQRLLARGDTGRLAAVLEDAVDQTRRGAAILERLRNWSRPRRGRLEAIDLGDVLANVRALLGPEAERLATTLTVVAPGGAVLVEADQVEMEQVIHNLVRNALEALEDQADARVDIALSVAGTDAVIEIADNGPGVDESILPELFAPFTTTREDGTGLGLALSQRLVERAGGEIVHVPGPSGATFRIVLPLARAGQRTAEAAQ